MNHISIWMRLKLLGSFLDDIYFQSKEFTFIIFVVLNKSFLHNKLAVEIQSYTKINLKDFFKTS